jgi:hypothetical protein
MANAASKTVGGKPLWKGGIGNLSLWSRKINGRPRKVAIHRTDSLQLARGGELGR